MSTPASATSITYEGFVRERRGPGVRNRVLVIPSVICSHYVADEIATQVPRAFSASHDHGCAQLGNDKAATHRTMVNVGLNPNVAGAVVVGLGCESIQSGDVVRDIEASGLPVEAVVIQELGGTDPCIEAGVDHAERLAADAARAGRSPTGIDELTVGVISSDLRDSTLDVAEPMVAGMIDRLMDAGGRVIVAGAERFTEASDSLASRLSTSSARAGFEEMHSRQAGTVGRLTRIHRRAASLPETALTGILGGDPVADVLAYGEQARHEEGLAIVDAPTRFEEAATGLAAAGAQLIVHVTGEGVPTGHPVVPVIKVTGDEETAAALGPDIDVNAHESEVEDVVEGIRDIASGRSTRAEEHGVLDFAISRFGPSM